MINMTIDEFLKLGSKLDVEKDLFDMSKLNDDELLPVTKDKSWDELFKKDTSDPEVFTDYARESQNNKLKGRFTEDGFLVPEFSFLKYIPYYVLLNIDRKGKKVIGSSFMYDDEKITVSDNIYNKAMEAINYLRSNFTSVETGVKAILGDSYNKASQEVNMDMHKFAGINTLQELLEKYANPYNVREQFKKEEMLKQKQQDAALKAKQQRELNTDHVLDTQREQARQRQMQEMNDYDARNRQQRQDEANSETPWQKEPVYAGFDEIDAPVEFFLSDDEVASRQKEHNSLLKRNPELFKEILQIDGEVSELGNSDLVMSLEFKDESEYTEEEKAALQRLESLIDKAQELYSQMK